jgi:hypothetical protein
MSTDSTERPMQYRRRVPRQRIGWSGQYLVEDTPDVGWRECLVVDISVLGAGVELYGIHSADLLGDRVIVDVNSPVGTSISVRMAGNVRNTAPGPSGGLRIGMEFIGLNDTERSILNTLERLQIAW